ncbi:UNVERIFIED_CONTAM: hypothetical protein FKN15_017359 [Acipenser sinensis]
MTQFTCFIVLLSVLSCMAFKEKVSRKCMQDTKRFIEDLNEDIPREYAALMYDAFGKMGSDFVGGNMNRPGSFSECILANSGDFSGQYCQVMLIQEQTGYLVGLCVPDSCDEAEIEILVANDVFQYKETSLVPPIPSVLLHNSTQQIPVSTTKCLKKNGTPDASAIVCLFVCSFILALPLLGTIYVALIKWKKQKLNLSTVGSNFKSDPNLYGTFLQHEVHQKHANSYSADVESPTEQKSGKEVEENNKNQTKAELFLPEPKFPVPKPEVPMPKPEVLTLKPEVPSPRTELPVLEPEPLLTKAEFLLPETYQQQTPVSRSPWCEYCGEQAHRWRECPDVLSYWCGLCEGFGHGWIQPLHIFMVCLSIGLLSVVPKGSFWSFAEMQIDICKKYWWTNMLLINNLFFYPNSCIPWSWYLAIDVQFYFTTPLLVFLLRRIHKAYFEYYYNKPYSRYGPYLIGILLGMFMNAKKDRLLKKQGKD